MGTGREEKRKNPRPEPVRESNDDESKGFSWDGEEQ